VPKNQPSSRSEELLKDIQREIRQLRDTKRPSAWEQLSEIVRANGRAHALADEPSETVLGLPRGSGQVIQGENAAVTLSSDYINAISGAKQRKLVLALNGKGTVSLDKVLTALYGSNDRKKLETLLRVKDRMNKRLTADAIGCEIRKRGETLYLASIG
jgi:hypothetical protein